MTTRLAHDPIELKHGGNTVQLRPSLRAGLLIVHNYTVPDIRRRLEQFDVTAFHYLVTVGSDQHQADAFLNAIYKDGVQHLEALRPKLAEFLYISLGWDFEPEKKPHGTATGADKQLSYIGILNKLFSFATGVLHWTPGETWMATPAEILVAHKAHLEAIEEVRFKSFEGSTTAKKPDPDQAARNIAEGLDPDYDRAGVRGIFAKMAGGA